MHTPPRILIVDDNETNRDILMARLGPQGYDLQQAADGEEALAAARNLLPDLILLDIMMPKIDGIELMRRRRGLVREWPQRYAGKSVTTEEWIRFVNRYTGRNLTAFLLAFTKDKTFVLDQTDDIQQGALITHDGAIVSMRVRDALQSKGKAS